MTSLRSKAVSVNGGLLARNAFYNLIGMVLPLAVAVIAMPLLINGLGTERFGVLALSWVVLGYFGVFDFGLGRVVTKMIGERLGLVRSDDIPAIAWTGLFFLALLGVIMSAVLYLLSPLLVLRVLKISADLQQEALQAFRVLAASVVFILLTVGLRAVQEAFQKFLILNIIRSANGVLIYLAPLALLPFTRTISHYVAALTAVRFLVLVANAAACAVQFPHIRRAVRLDLHLAKPMFRLGGWMSVSNIIGPVMVYFDRFLMGAWLSVAAVTFYVTPYEVITKLLVIISAVIQVLFPAFSMSLSADREKTAQLYSRALRVLLLLFFPITLGIVLFARAGLSLWLSPEFAEKSAGVAQWLAIGIFLNAPGQIAYILLQAGGRPDLTAQVHIVETPLYLAALFFGVEFFGITGAAVAWTLRLFIELFVLLFLVEKKLNLRMKNIGEFIRIILAEFSLLVLLTFFQIPFLFAAVILLLGSLIGLLISNQTATLYVPSLLSPFSRGAR